MIKPPYLPKIEIGKNLHLSISCIIFAGELAIIQYQ